MDSPVRNEYRLPLTPPSSSIKRRKDETLNELLSLKPKQLIGDLKKVKEAKGKRKPRLKYKPPSDTVFPLDEYLNEAAKKSAKDASFLVHVLKHSRRIICIQGAGVSVAAGIPDFRSENGLFSTLKGKSANLHSGKDLLDFNLVYSSTSMSILFNNLMNNLYMLSDKCTPTPFHRFVNSLAEGGQLKRLYTQNIDGLETKFPLLSDSVSHPPQIAALTVQLHGSIHKMSCMKCKKLYDMDPSLFKMSEESQLGEVIPHCPECKEFESIRSICGKRLQGVGKLKPNVVLYNEYHPEGDIISEMVNRDLKSNPDALLIVGTSLKIPGVRQMVKQFAAKVRSKKGFVIWINNDLPAQNIKKLINGCDLIVLGDCQNIPILMETLDP